MSNPTPLFPHSLTLCWVFQSPTSQPNRQVSPSRQASPGPGAAIPPHYRDPRPSKLLWLRGAVLQGAVQVGTEAPLLLTETEHRNGKGNIK